MVNITPNALTSTQCERIIERTTLEPRGDNRSDHQPLTLAEFEQADIITSLLDGLHGHHLKILRYRVGHHHPTHTDYFGKRIPARTLTIQLSDPDTYTGGILHIADQPMPTTRGTAITFESTTPHRVTRLDTGERWALTAWAYP